MIYFNSSTPIFCKKQITLEIQTLPGIWRIHWQIGNITLFSSFYTRLDQACILWGLISAVIFVTAQFMPISWLDQAVLWSALTLVGTVGMVWLTWFRVNLERLNLVLYVWVILMLSGLVITDLSIFLGWGEVLMHLCHLWLGLVAIGYFCNGLLMRSRAFILTGIVHLLCIFLLPYVGSWQFLTTGIVMGGSMLVLAEFRWDMHHTVDFDLLTREQKLYI